MQNKEHEIEEIMEKAKVDKIVILKNNIKPDLSKCHVCAINFTALQPCIICQLRIEKEQELGRKLTREEFRQLGAWLR